MNNCFVNEIVCFARNSNALMYIHMHSDLFRSLLDVKVRKFIVFVRAIKILETEV